MDNRYFNYECPPLMNDGRFISNYIRSSTFDQKIRTINSIYSAHEYRNYIQNNGSTLINNIKSYLHENNTCGVEGRCLPISGSKHFTNVQSNDVKTLWYEELLDEQPTQLDFMMHTNILTPHHTTNQVSHDTSCTTCTNK